MRQRAVQVQLRTPKDPPCEIYAVLAGVTYFSTLTILPYLLVRMNIQLGLDLIPIETMVIVSSIAGMMLLYAPFGAGVLAVFFSRRRWIANLIVVSLFCQLAVGWILLSIHYPMELGPSERSLVAVLQSLASGGFTRILLQTDRAAA